MGYTPNYSHLVGIMISKTIGCRGTLFSDTHLLICFFSVQFWASSVLRRSISAPRRPLAMAQAVSEHGIDCLRGNDDRLHCWLVVSIMYYFFPYIGNNNPNWLIFFRGVETTNQPLELAVFNPVADHRICDIDSLFRTFPDCDCMPWCHGQNGQLSESLHFTQEDSLQTSKSRGSSSFSYAKTAIIKWGHFPSRPLGDRCAKALMPGYDVQEVSKEVSRGQQWASGPDSCYPIPWGLVDFGAVRTDRDLWTVCWFMLSFFGLDLLSIWNAILGLAVFFLNVHSRSSLFFSKNMLIMLRVHACADHEDPVKATTWL